MVVTDLDGTLFQRERQVSPRNLETLRLLGRLRVLRVVATGRNLYSARKVLSPEFPVDVLVFSSGVGVLDWPRGRLLRAVSMGRPDLGAAFRALEARSLDFMVHRPLPDNHHFVYYSTGIPNPDFEARCALYRDFAVAGRRGALTLRKASQLLAVEPGAGPPAPAVSRHHASLKEELAGLHVVRTTSPLDGRSCWIEIFSAGASKSLASAWVARRFGVPLEDVLAVGNDFNDLDLLEWAPRGYLVGGSPAELSGRFPLAGGSTDADFSVAVARWARDTLSLPGFEP